MVNRTLAAIGLTREQVFKITGREVQPQWLDPDRISLRGIRAGEMNDKGATPDQIADIMKVPVEQVHNWLGMWSDVKKAFPGQTSFTSGY